MKEQDPGDLFNVTDDGNEDLSSSLFSIVKENKLTFVPIQNQENAEENNARESWNRKSVQQRKSISYLTLNSHLR